MLCTLTFYNFKSTDIANTLYWSKIINLKLRKKSKLLIKYSHIFKFSFIYDTFYLADINLTSYFNNSVDNSINLITQKLLN